MARSGELEQSKLQLKPHLLGSGFAFKAGFRAWGHSLFF